MHERADLGWPVAGCVAPRGTHINQTKLYYYERCETSLFLGNGQQVSTIDNTEKTG
jgi:hypothetical protein